jgi:phosphoenolpyruvate---glycerone phosphotransferase subunit DhaL
VGRPGPDAGAALGRVTVPGERGSIDAAAVGRWLERFAALVDRDRDLLTELDAAIGDADHGLNMARGMAAVRERLGTAAPPAEAEGPAAATSPATPASLCRDAAMTLISTVGGASGPLYGTFFLRLAGALPAAPEVDPAAFVAGLRAGVDGVAARGRAAPGDKTMLDALAPAVEALEAAVGAPPPPGSLTTWAAAAARAADAAARGSDATVPLVARRGRASYLGERSAGHRDPGAASSALLFAALAEALVPGAADQTERAS